MKVCERYCSGEKSLRGPPALLPSISPARWMLCFDRFIIRAHLTEQRPTTEEKKKGSYSKISFLHAQSFTGLLFLSCPRVQKSVFNSSQRLKSYFYAFALALCFHGGQFYGGRCSAKKVYYSISADIFSSYISIFKLLIFTTEIHPAIFLATEVN